MSYIPVHVLHPRACPTSPCMSYIPVHVLHPRACPTSPCMSYIPMHVLHPHACPRSPGQTTLSTCALAPACPAPHSKTGCVLACLYMYMREGMGMVMSMYVRIEMLWCTLGMVMSMYVRIEMLWCTHEEHTAIHIHTRICNMHPRTCARSHFALKCVCVFSRQSVIETSANGCK